MSAACRFGRGVSFALLFWCGCHGRIGDAPGGSEPAPGGTGVVPPPGGGGAPGNSGNVGGSPGAQPPARCQNRTIHPGKAPVRRLTRFEYNNTVRDLLGDTTEPALALPADEIANGFGNDAAALSVSSLLVEQYGSIAEGIAARATQGTALNKLVPCAATVMAGSEDSCTRTFVGNFLPRAYRRPVTQAETDELVALARSVRTGSGFASGIAAVIEVVLQAPEFLYRLEWGAADPMHPELRRPTGDEMAARLSYLFWGTMPDEKLRASARAGELSTAEGVLAQATRLADDPRARPVVRFFFDNLLPISGLGALERDRTVFPTYSGSIGALMREEAQRLLEDEIFTGSGSWPGVLLADHTFVNGPLAAFYGMSGVTGDSFRKVPLDKHRLGLLTLGGIMAGTTPSNNTNPVLRGSFVVRKLMCKSIPLPTGDILAKVKPPEPYTAKTARERFTLHKMDPVCRACHQEMDPVGLAFENFNPVGLWRDTENGVTIDASATVPGTGDMVAGPLELVRKLAALEDVNACLASHFMDFAYGQSADARDECVQANLVDAFAKSGHDVRKLLLALTQTDEFLYFTPRP